jgi:hypothetical protein
MCPLLAAVCTLLPPQRGIFTTCLVSAAAAIKPDPISSAQLRHSKCQDTRPAAADPAATGRPTSSATHQPLWSPPSLLYLPLASALNSRAAIVCPQPCLLGPLPAGSTAAALAMAASPSCRRPCTQPQCCQLPAASLSCLCSICCEELWLLLQHEQQQIRSTLQCPDGVHAWSAAACSNALNSTLSMLPALRVLCSTPERRTGSAPPAASTLQVAKRGWRLAGEWQKVHGESMCLRNSVTGAGPRKAEAAAVQSLTVLGLPSRVKMAGATPAASNARAVSFSVQRSSSACSTAQCTCIPCSGQSSAIRCTVRPSTCAWYGAWLEAATPGPATALRRPPAQCQRLLRPAQNCQCTRANAGDGYFSHTMGAPRPALRGTRLSYPVKISIGTWREGIANSQRNPRASDLTARAHDQPFPAMSNCDVTAGGVSDRV